MPTKSTNRGGLRERLFEIDFWVANLLIALAVVDLVVAGFVYDKSHLAATHVVLFGLALLVLLRREIGKFKLAADGFEFESASAAVQSAAADLAALAQPHERLAKLSAVNRHNGTPEWGRLAMNRLALRALLARLIRTDAEAAEELAFSSADARIPRLEKMLQTAARRKLLEPAFAAELERLRAATVFVEWLQPIPPVTELHFALTGGQYLIEKLDFVVAKREPSAA